MSEDLDRAALALAQAREAHGNTLQRLADAEDHLRRIQAALSDIRKALVEHGQDLGADGYFNRARDFSDLIGKLDTLT